MAINYNLLQQIPGSKIIGQIQPSAGGGDDGIGDLLSGLKGLIGGIAGASGGGSATGNAGGAVDAAVNQMPQMAPQASVSPGLAGTARSMSGPVAQPMLGNAQSITGQGSYGMKFNQPTLTQRAYQNGVNLNGMNETLMSRTNQLMADLRQQGFEPIIASGNRTKAEQAEKVKKGYSKTMNSNHIGGGAVDIIDKRYGWNTKQYGDQIKGFAEAMAKTAPKYGLFSGTQWKSFGPYGDFAHIQLPKQQRLQGQANVLGGSVLGSKSQSMYNQDLPHVMAGIAGVESAGAKNPYGLMSKPSRGGDRAYGKYQIMGSNVPVWTKEATGKSYTPQQFLANPDLQEQTARYKINQSLEKGYSPQDAASIWFTGRPYAKAGGRVKDVYGTTNDMYQQKFNRGYLQSKEGIEQQNGLLGSAQAEPGVRLSLNDDSPLPIPGRPPMPPQAPHRFQPMPQQLPPMMMAQQGPQEPINPLSGQPQNPNDPNAQSGINWGLLAAFNPQGNGTTQV